MKHFFLLLLLLTSTTLASDSFWHKLIQIEEDFFNNKRVLTLVEQESNQTIVDKNSTTTALLDAQLESFASLINLLKNNPYSLDVNGTLFIDKKKSSKKIRNLKLKIETNRKYGYTEAVKRDTIKLESLQLKEQIDSFFRYIAKKWTLLEEDDFLKLIEETQKRLHATVDIEKSSEIYNEVKNQKGVLPKRIKENFLILSRDYYFFDATLNYLKLNMNIFSYYSISNWLKLDNLIEYINQKDSSKKVNLYLRYLKIDAGRLTLFFLTLLFFILLNYLIYKRLYNYFKSKILEVEDETDDVLLANLNRIRIPISLLVNGIGLQLALEILDYPNSLESKTQLYFSIFFIVIIAYIIMQIIENLFFIYFHSSNKRNITLRTELINLILSVSKFIILLIALLVIFVKMGINISGVIASLGIGGLAVALAAKDTLSNFFGLIKIIFDESFSQGDWIKTDDVEGTVVEIGFISTKIRTFDNAMITVPNEKLANASLRNWSKRTIGRRIKLYVGVTYNSNPADIQMAINEIESMLLNHEGISSSKRINKQKIIKKHRMSNKFVSLDNKLGIKSNTMVYLDKFSDSSIDILIYTFSKTTNWQEWLAIKEDILYKIWEILEKNSLEFAFPSQTVYLEQNKNN